MAKSDTALKHIKLDKAYTPPRSPAWAEDTPINGFDTETGAGSVFALSYAYHDQPGQVIHDNQFLSGEAIFDAITNRNCRSAINVWYNLNFDANAMLNHILDKEQWAEIVVTGTTNIVYKEQPYEITYIPSKFLQIKDGNKNTYLHFDVSQFFYGSLDDASSEWLDQSKLDDNIDTSKFGADSDQVNTYIKDRYHDIIKYAKKDAELVRDIWQAVVNEGEGLDIPMGKPFSTGYLAESYLNQYFDYKPSLPKLEVSSIAWDSYNGGRFEVMQRGDIGAVAGPDINSAYPHFLSTLPDPSTLTWRHIHEPDFDLFEQADYGFIKINVTTYKDNPIQPFTRKDSNGLVYYPRFYKTETTTLLDTFLFAYRNDMIKDFELLDCWLGFSLGSTHYPFTFIQDLYTQRKQYESNNFIKKGQLLKIVLNSMYGKMCQTTPKAGMVDDLDRELLKAEKGDNYSEFVLSDQQLPDALTYKYQSGIVEWLEAGSWFNPFIATYITGLTRLELHKRLVQYGLVEDTIMLATDSVMINKDAFAQSDFRQDLVSPELGMWDFDYTGDAFVIGPGVYEVAMGDKIKTKTRGFNESALFDQFDTLKDAARQVAKKGKNVIPIETNRPRTAAELLWQNKPLSQVSEFFAQTRELSADFDNKRQWPKAATYRTLLSATQRSAPREVRA